MKYKRLLMKMEFEEATIIPETKVVNVLRDYINGTWMHPDERKTHWDKVLAAIQELDASAIERIRVAEERNERRKYARN